MSSPSLLQQNPPLNLCHSSHPKTTTIRNYPSLSLATESTMNFEPFSFILERLAVFMENEFITLTTDTKSAVDSLRNELQMMESYFIDVDKIEQQASMTRVSQTQLQQLREIAPQIEDLLDTLHQEAEDRNHGSILKKLKVFISSSNPLIRTRQMAEKVRELKDILKETIDRPKGYQLPSYLPQVTHKRRNFTRPQIVDDEVIVGLEEDLNILIAEFVGREGKHIMTTLAVVGMGGSGKTTLAKKLYNHKEIMGKFSSHAWVCVSCEWDTPHLLREICVQVGIQLPKGETLIYLSKLQEFLERNSCLIVLDDVWKMEALQEMFPAIFPSCRRGSGSVLITTRNEEIFKFPIRDGIHIHKARCLTQGESWELFSAIIRKNWLGICSFEEEGDFARLGKEMLEKCNGLPLAVIAVAGILSTKDTIQDWENVKNDMSSRIMRYNKGFHDYGPVKEMLELSYFDLPYHLKPCFLYLGIFCEDDRIDAKELILLWIAEGFIKSDQCLESETLEEVARLFLHELIQRCLVQVDGTNGEGKVTFIRIHDLLRGLCIEKAKDLNFFQISSRSASVSHSMESVSRRTIIYPRNSVPTLNRYLRSLICLGDRGGATTNIELPYANMKLLRVLVLQKVELKDSAKQIGSLVLLRYLKIQWCSGTIPESIRNLRNLLSFIYCGDGAEIKDNLFCNMEHLRHLCLTCGPITNSVLGVNKSRSLQSLTSPAAKWLTNEILSVWIGLRELRLMWIHNQAQLDAVSDFVSNPSCHLYTVFLSLKEHSMLQYDLERLKLEDCRHLKGLGLVGKVRQKQKLPLVFPPNLLSLQLAFSQIGSEEDLKGALAGLRQLRFLNLKVDSYTGERLTIKGLPQLQELILEALFDLKEVRIEKGSLPQLKRFEFLQCNQLERIPMEIRYIHSLQSFEALHMSKSFCERLQRPSNGKDGNDSGDEGEDFHLIRHVPFINISKSYGNH